MCSCDILKGDFIHNIVIALNKLIIYKIEIRFTKTHTLLMRFYEFGSIVRVQRAYWAKFNEKNAQNHSKIKNIVSVFEKTGSVRPTPPKRKSPN